MIVKRHFFHLFIAEIKRGFGVLLFTSIILTGFVILLDSWDSITALMFGAVVESDACCYYYYFNSIIYEGVFASYFFPILAVIPYATSYCIENETSVQYWVMSKTGMKNYCASKFLCGAFYGGLALGLGTVLLILLLSLKIPLIGDLRLEDAALFPYFRFLLIGNGLHFFLIAAYLSMLTGILWASCAMTVSAYMPNKYVVVVSPFILKFALVRFYALTRFPAELRLDLWLCGRTEPSTDGKSLIYITIFTCLISFVCSIIFSKRIRERIASNE